MMAMFEARGQLKVGQTIRLEASDVTLTVSKGTPGTKRDDWGDALKLKGQPWGDLGRPGTQGPSG
jgi:hypothetical protein